MKMGGGKVPSFPWTSLMISMGFLSFFCSGVNGLNIVCPNFGEIPYCTCSTDGSIGCSGKEVTQVTIDKLLDSVRAVNNIPSYQYLEISNLQIHDTELTIIYLDHFLGYRVQNFVLDRNAQLYLVNFSPNVDRGSVSSIPFQATHVQITRSSVTETSLKDLFYQLRSSTLNLDLSYNKIWGLEREGEFLEGLSALSELQFLYLQWNGIRSIRGAPFKHGVNLLLINLSDNQIERLGKDAFKMDPPPPALANTLWTIDLSRNKLTDEGITSEDIGITTIGEPTRIALRENQFVYISQAKFQGFLYADSRNLLELYGNHFICDDRMKWLKEDRAKLERQVTGVNCENDPGKTIFTTDLVVVSPYY
jgi:hypothetical protein